MSVLGEIYNSLALISPKVEVLLRQLYWNNVSKLKRFNPHRTKSYKSVEKVRRVDFDKIIDWLRLKGVGEGSLLIVHSSYSGLECTGLSLDEMINKLLTLVGETGTLAMPVIRKFKEGKNAIKPGEDIPENIVCKYDVMKTLITSGLLPYTLMHREGAVTSLFPLNPLCAIGPLAKEMMVNNLDGECPSPHGPNSSWKFCYDHDAFVCSLGIDLEHHNTSIHIAEEAFGDWYWPDNEWYHVRHFDIIDENRNIRRVKVKERRAIWGTRHIAEINMSHDMKKRGVLQSDKIDETVDIGFAKVRDVVDFLRTRNSNGYPYVK